MFLLPSGQTQIKQTTKQNSNKKELWGVSTNGFCLDIKHHGPSRHKEKINYYSSDTEINTLKFITNSRNSLALLKRLIDTSSNIRNNFTYSLHTSQPTKTDKT